MTTNGEWLFSKPFDEQVAWMNAEHQDGTLDGDTAALNAKIAELTAERDDLKANNEQLHILAGEQAATIDELQAEVDELTQVAESKRLSFADRIRFVNEIDELKAERERYREKFGKCLDYADAIHALMDDEGMA